MKQTLTIPNYVPEQLANGPHGHWSKKAKVLAEAKQLSYFYVKLAKWVPVASKARLSICFVFPARRRRDIDNLTSRCKGIQDGVKLAGVIVDDDSEHLDLLVSARVEKGRKYTEMTLEELGTA